MFKSTDKYRIKPYGIIVPSYIKEFKCSDNVNYMINGCTTSLSYVTGNISYAKTNTKAIMLFMIKEMANGIIKVKVNIG